MKNEFDVVIVGGGIAGSVAAWTFRQSGLSVALVDERAKAHSFFRAERISHGVGEILKELGIFDALGDVSLSLEKTATIRNGKVTHVSTDFDYSAPVGYVVQALRDKMKEVDGIEMVIEPAQSAECSEHQQTLVLKSGRKLDAKLLVVATGGSTAFLKSLGVRRKILSKNHSSTFGFNINAGANFQLPANSVTVRICRDDADYMNIFPMPEGGYRANLFTYWPAGSKKQREFVTGDTDSILRSLVPNLKNVTGEWAVEGAVDCGSVSVLKSDGYQDKSGLVLIGDAYGRICPCGGKGVAKVLNDILALRDLVPAWITDDVELTPKKLNELYLNSKRTDFEEQVYCEAIALRDRMMKKTPYWTVNRFWYRHAPHWLKVAVWKLKSGRGYTSGLGAH